MNKFELETILISNDIFEREKYFLIDNFPDFQKLFHAILGKEKIKFCYLYKKKSHEIIYNEEETIRIDKIENNLSDYFYLTSSIEEGPDIINYSYDIDLINAINSNNKAEKNELSIIINSKIILVLANNFLGKTQNDTIIEEIDKIKEENNNKINNNIHILYEFDLNDIDLEKIKGKKLYSLYIDILKSLIRKNKFEDYEYTYKIIKQLSLENISITKPMFVELYKILINNEPYLNFYKIKKIEDLFNKKIINFYFILFKYIFKKEILIYNFPWLLEVKKIIIDAIKKKENKLFSTNLDDNDLIKRKEYILKFITDSSYYYDYYKKQWNEIKEKLNIILNYYQNYFFETKIDDIKSIKEIINKENGNFEKYFNDLDIANKMNDRYEIIKFINDSKFKDEQKESNLQESIKTWEKLEKLINDKKISQIDLNYKDFLSKFLQEEKNKKIFIKIFNRDLFRFNILNEELQIIDYLFNNEDKGKDNNIEKNETEIIKQKKYWIEIRESIKLKKLKKIKKFILDKLIIYFKDEKNKEILSKIFTPESIIFLINYIDKKSDNIKLNEILLCYKQFLPETKKNEINILEQIIKNIFEFDNYEKYLIDYEEAKKKNIRAPIIKYFMEPKNEGIPITEEIMKKEENKWNSIEKMLKDQKTKKIKKNIKIKIKDLFENNEYEILHKIFSKENIDYIKKNIVEPLKDDISSKDKNENLNQNNNTDKKNGLCLPIYEQNKESINYGTTMKQTEEKNTIKTKEIIFTEKSEIIEDVDNIKGIEKEISEKKAEDTANIKEKEKKKDIIKSDIKIEEKEKQKQKDISIKQEKKIIKNILKKTIIKFNIFKTEKNNCIELYKIKYGERLIQLGVDKWNKIIEKYKNSSENEKQDEIFKIFQKFSEFYDGIKNDLVEKFKLDYKLEIELNLEVINNRENNEIYNISCIYIFYPPLKDSEKIIFNDNDILIPNSSKKGFHNLLEEINSEKYKNEKTIDYNDSLFQQNSFEKTKSEYNYKNDSLIQNSFEKTKSELNNNVMDKIENQTTKKKIINNKYSIITFKDIIGQHKEERSVCTAEFIAELSNIFVSGGTDKILIIYTNDFKTKINIDDIKEWTYSVNERKTNIANAYQIIASANKDLYLIDLKFDENGSNNYNLQKYEFPNMTCVRCIGMTNEDYATVGLYCSYYFYNLFTRKSDRVNHTPIINNKTYRSAIKIKHNILALASNRVAVDGEDRLFFLI